MDVNINGNNVRVHLEANEITNNRVHITLPAGYSYESIHITYLYNITEIRNYVLVNNNNSYKFPPVRSHSPSTFDILVVDVSKKAELRLIIEKFGQIPDPHYFDKAFDPILVTGEDGNQYKVIPSDQFK